MSDTREHAYASCSDADRQNLFYCDACNRAEVEALLARVAELEAAMSQIAEWDGEEPENSALVAKVDTLTKQLVAATNDAARAELRAQGAVAAIERLLASAVPHPIDHPTMTAAWAMAREFLDASPDSDARLREVMRNAIRRAYSLHRLAVVPDELVKAIIDEVLGVKP